MMQRTILMDQNGDQLRLAVIEDNELVELFVEGDDRESLIGNIYMGRADNVLPGMQAAFVDIGLEKNGFLSTEDSPLNQLNKPLKPGNELMVQVVKQPDGDKGPRLTTSITLPGRALVLLPTLSHVSISKKIDDELERARLRELARAICPQGMGLIIRTAAMGADERTLKADVDELVEQWRAIADSAPYRKAPALLYQTPGLIDRSIRDMLLPDVEALVIQGAGLYERVMQSAASVSDSLVEKLKLHTSDTPLFSLYSVDSQAEKALNRKVWLDSGGYLIFDYAEALTVIDVNSGKFVGKQSLSQTVYVTNREAAVEIAKQLRLRDIGGIVIIDFIDMDKPEQKQELLSLFAAELRRDRSKTHLIGMTGLGLVELTRKKLTNSMVGARAVCPVCKGSGRVDAKKRERA